MKERCEWRVIPSGLVISHATQLGTCTLSLGHMISDSNILPIPHNTLHSTADRMDVVVGQILRPW